MRNSRNSNNVLKITRSQDIDILSKPQKDLELVPSHQVRAKNKLEIVVISCSNALPNFMGTRTMAVKK